MKLRTLFSRRPLSGVVVALGVALGLLVAGSAQAAIVTLTFSGTYNIIAGPFGGSVFGQSGSVSYNFQITYDTTLNTNTFFFATGASLGGFTTTHEWHGYSASGITATSLTFGTQTWTAGDLDDRAAAGGVSAGLWFDTDISLATPTRCWIFFDGGSPGSGSLQLGGGSLDEPNIILEQTSAVREDPFFPSPGGNGFSSQMNITSIITGQEENLASVKDSFLRDGADNTNEGANPFLRVQASGRNRPIVAFDLADIDITRVTSARLILTIVENADNWGPNDDRTVEAHPLLVDFAEGNGKTAGVPRAEATRGSGPGVTWACATDSEIANQRVDCTLRWNGGTFGPATALPVVHSNGQRGEVQWEVTADVLAGATGWVIKKTNEGQSGQVAYSSKEGPAPPQLILTLE